MAEGDWRCGVCAAPNEEAVRACLVCDTVRTAARPAGPADLLAEPVGADAFHAPVPPPLAAQDPPPVRVVEPPGLPLRSPAPGPGPAGPLPEAPAVPVPAVPAPTVSVPAEAGGASDPGGGGREPVTEPLPVVGGRSRDRPRVPPGTVRALALGALGLAAVALWWWPDGEEPDRAPSGPAAQVPCPDRVAELIPGSGNGPLVESYETSRHRIVLCADGTGDLYCFGEFLDGTGEPMVVPARRDGDGYTAQAGETRYEISGGRVAVIGGDGTELARHDLVEVDPGR
ncbi:hypothetical protein [Nocardiopsis sp. NPDC057823]|uniref:hypothetical protein n=1 Tax=Nocardiopsis sp. NPDC057823 TaxID=3346256 RepID=UPI003671F741